MKHSPLSHAERRLGMRLKRKRYHGATHLHHRPHRDGYTATHPIEEAAGTEGAAEYEELIAKQREHLMRLQAEFENFRRRTKKEVQTIKDTASYDVLQGLLPILDNFQRALDAPSTDAQGILEGVKMIYGLLKHQLREAGLETMDVKGKPFDPQYHDAVEVDSSGEHEENTVVDVLQDGYMVKGRLVRPALVKVSRHG
jgi:molecular chaperone GrpE